MECENCGKDCDLLTRNAANNGNKDDGWYCDDCYKEIHEKK